MPRVETLLATQLLVQLVIGPVCGVRRWLLLFATSDLCSDTAEGAMPNFQLSHATRLRFCTRLLLKTGRSANRRSLINILTGTCRVPVSFAVSLNTLFVFRLV